MNLKSLSMVVLLAVASFSSTANAESCETPLADSMGAMKKNIRSFMGAYKSGDSDMQKQYVAELVKLAKAGADEMPLKADGLSGDAKQEMIDSYKAGMEKLVEQFVELEQLVAAGDSSGIGAQMKAIQDHNKASHRKYKKKC